ncbi:DUF11 domain-containing protein [Candidatus Microgenomates bacterium]|nr:DUF11 domain-containing protein [Candidatus Microgenomates bacterium]
MNLKKLLAAILVFLLIFNPFVIPLAFAQEENPEAATQEEQGEEEEEKEEDKGEGEEEEDEEGQEEQEKEQDQEEKEARDNQEIEEEVEGDTDGIDTPEDFKTTPTPLSSITTGDTASEAETKTILNYYQEEVEGEITGGDCSLEGEIECSMAHANEADSESSADAQSTTGENEILNTPGDAVIDSGTATAIAEAESIINTNITELIPADNLEADSFGELEDDEEDGGHYVINNNEATTEDTSNVEASSGDNKANGNQGDATVTTGPAYASANLVDIINTNILGSNFEVLLFDINDETGDINLLMIWNQLEQETGKDLSGVLVLNSNSTNLLIVNHNEAQSDSLATAIADSGGNEASNNEGKATIETGDAYASANIFKLVNTNIIGGKFLFVVINIFGDFSGNIIVPSRERFLEGQSTDLDSDSDGSFPQIVNQNEAVVEGGVLAIADSGNNESNNNGGDNMMETGSAAAQANAISVVNLNIHKDNWYQILFNNLGEWLGKISGWSSPDAQETAEEGLIDLSFDGNHENGDSGQETQAQSGDNDNGTSPLFVFNQNKTQSSDQVMAQAKTGGNQVNNNDGGVTIKTGAAKAIANLVRFVNVNILGGRFFFPIINLFGRWTGNLIFAYPEIAVNLTNGIGRVVPGEIYQYTVNFVNQGYDRASDVFLQLELPDGVIFLGDSSGITPQVIGGTCIWSLGSLEVGEAGTFKIKVQIDSEFSGEEPLSFWSKLIPQAHAAESERENEVITTVSIETVDPEPDFSNNVSSAKTTVYFPISEEAKDDMSNQGKNQTGEENADSLLPLPQLEITAWNNVGEFVYPGDTVTFEITVKNIGEGISYDTYVTQELFNGLPEKDFGTAKFEIGKLDVGKAAKLTFGLKLDNGEMLSTGFYHTVAQAYGYSFSGVEVKSNEAKTQFEIRTGKNSFFPGKVKAAEGEILANTIACPSCKKEEDILPYLLLFLLSSTWLVNWGKMKLAKKEVSAQKT